MDAAEQMASRGDRRGWHVRGSRPGFNLRVRVVVQRTGIVELSVPECDVRFFRQHTAVQRQPAVALRRLLHFVRYPRDTEPSSKIVFHFAAMDGAPVSGNPITARPLFTSQENVVFTTSATARATPSGK